MLQYNVGRSLSSGLRANFSIDLSAGDTLVTLPEQEIRMIKATCNRKRRLSVTEEDEMRVNKKIRVR